MTELLRELEAVVRKKSDFEGMTGTANQMDRAIGDASYAAYMFVYRHHAEIAEAVKDARRYRHIKSAPAGTVRADFNAWLPSYYPWGNGTKSLDEQIDAAIDAHNSAREAGE